MRTDHASREHAVLSASSAHRWLQCTPSARIAETYPHEDTPYTLEGTLAHEMAESIARGHTESLDDPVLQEAGVTAEMIRCAEAYRDYIEELKQDDNAVVLLEQRVDYAPYAPEGFGTVDCLILQGTHLDVVDYKYGQGVAVSAEDNPQLRLYGLGALYEYGDVYEIQTVSLHIFQPRKGAPSVERLTVDELMAWADEIAPRAEAAYKGQGVLSVGDHCRFCPHLAVCPELGYQAGHTMDWCADPPPQLGPQQIADLLRKAPILTVFLTAVKERALSALLAGEDIPGYKVVAGRGSRAWRDEVAVAHALDAAGVSRDDYTETKMLTPAALEKAIGKKTVAELLPDLIQTKPGAPTVAPETDKRPVYDRLAQAKQDFDD